MRFQNGSIQLPSRNFIRFARFEGRKHNRMKSPFAKSAVNINSPLKSPRNEVASGRARARRKIEKYIKASVRELEHKFPVGICIGRGLRVNVVARAFPVGAWRGAARRGRAAAGSADTVKEDEIKLI